MPNAPVSGSNMTEAVIPVNPDPSPKNDPVKEPVCEPEKEPDMIQEIITHIKLPLIVACLTLLINLDPITELFKGHSILFDVENNKFTIVTTIIKALLIGLLFFGINFAINK